MRRLARVCGETWDNAEFWEVMSCFQELCGVLTEYAANDRIMLESSEK